MLTRVELDAGRLSPLDGDLPDRSTGSYLSAGVPRDFRDGRRQRADSPSDDAGGVVDAMVRLSVLALDLGDRLAALDVNPLIASPTGCMAVDALVVSHSAVPDD